MRSGRRVAYNAAAPVAEAGARVAAWFLPKMREAVSGRRGLRARWETLAAVAPARPVWFHVASVGEFEQARPVITAIERAHPALPVIVTFSSPSGYAFARRKERVGDGAIQFIDYLPFDRADNMRACVATARPRLLVVVKFDLWPNLVWQAGDAGVPVVLIDATLSPSSRRLAFPARWLYADVYRRLDAILAISDADAARFARAAPGHPRISVTGDTRFDRVMERWNARAKVTVDIPRHAGPTVIAGSTWPADESHLLPALERLMRDDPALRAVIVPHEPVAAHVEPLRRWAAGTGMTTRLFSRDEDGGSARIVILDAVGMLAEAYRLADVAYVGGAFTTGVHSVIEPAIAGIPSVFGPLHDNSFEALQLVERRAATAVRTTDETYAALRRYLTDDSARRAAGAAARSYVESQLGATEKCMAVLERYL